MRYVWLILAVLMLSGFGLPSCATFRGSLDVEYDDKGNIVHADFESKGGVIDLKVKGNSLEMKGRESDKESFVEKAAGKAYSFTERALLLEESKEARGIVQ